jgi:hypothetical protein
MISRSDPVSSKTVRATAVELTPVAAADDREIVESFRGKADVAAPFPICCRLERNLNGYP